jgi:hypothetical protein
LQRQGSRPLPSERLSLQAAVPAAKIRLTATLYLLQPQSNNNSCNI